MARPPVTDWFPVGRGWQATVRAPYQDLEVYPVGDGWRWRVLAIDPSTGLFREAASGQAGKLNKAQEAAMKAAGQ